MLSDGAVSSAKAGGALCVESAGGTSSAAAAVGGVAGAAAPASVAPASLPFGLPSPTTASGVSFTLSPNSPTRGSRAVFSFGLFGSPEPPDKNPKRILGENENAALRREVSARSDGRGDEARGRGGVVEASTSSLGRGWRTNRCSMTSHVGFGAGDVTTEGSGLSSQRTKRSQGFETGSRSASAQKSIKASFSLTLAISVTFETGGAGAVGTGDEGAWIDGEWRDERREWARREDLRDKGMGGGAVTSTSLSHSVATRSLVRDVLPNP